MPAIWKQEALPQGATWVSQTRNQWPRFCPKYSAGSLLSGQDFLTLWLAGSLEPFCYSPLDLFLQSSRTVTPEVLNTEYELEWCVIHPRMHVSRCLYCFTFFITSFCCYYNKLTFPIKRRPESKGNQTRECVLSEIVHLWINELNTTIILHWWVFLCNKENLQVLICLSRSNLSLCSEKALWNHLWCSFSGL